MTNPEDCPVDSSGGTRPTRVATSAVGYYVAVVVVVMLDGVGLPWRTPVRRYWEWLLDSGFLLGLPRVYGLASAGAAVFWGVISLYKTQYYWKADRGWSPRTVGMATKATLLLLAGFWLGGSTAFAAG